MQPHRRDAAPLAGPSGTQCWTVSRLAPAKDLAAFVDYFWIVRWDAPTPHRQQVIPLPVVHLACEDFGSGRRLWAHGPGRDRFERTLTGEGRVVAACMLPGGFRPFAGKVASLAGRVVPAAALCGVRDDELVEAVSRDLGDAGLVAPLQRWLRACHPEPDPMVGELAALVARAEADSSVVRAEQLASHAGVSLRTLQRRFDEYVGVGPKWTIARFRVLDAARAARQGEQVAWAELASRLGYSDQAHLTRVFTAVVGTSPAAYAQYTDPRGEEKAP